MELRSFQLSRWVGGSGIRDDTRFDKPRFAARECGALSIVLPTVATVRRLATCANDHILQYIFAANRALNIGDDGSLIVIDKFDSLGVDEHQLVKKVETKPNEIVKFLMMFDIARFGND